MYSGNCYSCYQGYTLTNGACVLSILTSTNSTSSGTGPSSNCLQWNNSCCVKCATGYVLTNMICVIVPPVNTHCLEWMNGNCCICQSGYTLTNGLCVAVIVVPPVNNATAPPSSNSTTNIYCSSFVNGICVNCYVGYYINAGICVLVPGQCATYDMNSGLCLSCYE
jgi:hypothetical protein